jgi:multiple sugar transport system permease protein
MRAQTVGERADRVAPAARPARPGQRRERLIGWSFALPFVVFFTVFMAGPIIAALVTSFTDMRVTDIRNPLSVDLVGLDNYAAVLRDPVMHKAAGNTAIFVLLGIPLTMALGLAAAVGLNQGIVKFRTVFRVGYYMPVVTSIAAIAVVWRMLLGAEIGLINGVLSIFGVTGPGWLTNPSLALPSLIVMTAWRNMGFLMIIFLAGLQTIPQDLYEAAEVDGAGRWQRFLNVTFPLLRPTMLFAAVITGIGYLQFFEEPFVMTQGGPLNATLSVAFHAYNQFSFGNYGYTAAASYLLFVAIALLTVFWFRLFRPAT